MLWLGLSLIALFVAVAYLALREQAGSKQALLSEHREEVSRELVERVLDSRRRGAILEIVNWTLVLACTACIPLEVMWLAGTIPTTLAVVSVARFRRAKRWLTLVRDPNVLLRYDGQAYVFADERIWFPMKRWQVEHMRNAAVPVAKVR